MGYVLGCGVYGMCVCVCLSMSAYVNMSSLQQKKGKGVKVSKIIIYAGVARVKKVEGR